jgi:hypothetical protein
MKILALMMAAAATLVFATTVHAQVPRAKKAVEGITRFLKGAEHSSGHVPDWMEWFHAKHSEHALHQLLEHWEQGWRDTHEKREPENRMKGVQ